MPFYDVSTRSTVQIACKFSIFTMIEPGEHRLTGRPYIDRFIGENGACPLLYINRMGMTFYIGRLYFVVSRCSNVRTFKNSHIGHPFYCASQPRKYHDPFAVFLHLSSQFSFWHPLAHAAQVGRTAPHGAKKARAVKSVVARTGSAPKSKFASIMIGGMMAIAWWSAASAPPANPVRTIAVITIGEH